MHRAFSGGFLARAAYRYLVDPSRQRHYSSQRLQRYQDAVLRKAVKKAYTVPLYHAKFKTAHIHPSDIHNIGDLPKLPLLSKDDLRPYLSLRPSTEPLASTSGTTGTPLALPLDEDTILRSMISFVRVLREQQISWYRTRIALLLDLTANSYENGYFITSLFPALRPIIPLQNIRIYDLKTPPLNLLEQLTSFHPEVIISYPFILNRLASLRKQGLGSDLAITAMGSTGAYLNRYSRKQIEQAFHTRLFEIYAATETGPIAFECQHGKYHLFSDLVLHELPQSPGPIILTKLYGAGIPIIRYTGLDDIVSNASETCTCGLTGPCLSGIHGRRQDALILSDGRRVCISALDTIIGKTLSTMETIDLQRIQIRQTSPSQTDIDLCFNEPHPNETEFCSRLHDELARSLGSEMKITITPVPKIDPDAPYITIQAFPSRHAESYIV